MLQNLVEQYVRAILGFCCTMTISLGKKLE
jgi:hypothetical protein